MRSTKTNAGWNVEHTHTWPQAAKTNAATSAHPTVCKQPSMFTTYVKIDGYSPHMQAKRLAQTHQLQDGLKQLIMFTIYVKIDGHSPHMQAKRLAHAHQLQDGLAQPVCLSV